MGIPTIKTIKKRLPWLSQTYPGTAKGALLVRQAMEWAEHGAYRPPGSTLKWYFEEFRVMPFKHLEDFRSYSDRVRVALKIMDHGLDTHGVEYIASDEDDYHRVYGLEYLNTGDTYTPTVIFDWGKEKWEITSWGDIVESEPERFPY